MLTGLSACVFFIFLLKSDHARQFWASLGLGSQVEMLSWCSERVSKVSFPSNGGGVVSEVDGKWQWESTDGQTQLDYLAVEKWFARYCQTPIESIALERFDTRLLPLMEVEFIDGNSGTFYDLGQGRIQWKQQIFKSPSFQTAFEEILRFGPSAQ